MVLSIHERIHRVTPFALIPYLLITLITIPYFIHQKIIISRRIKNIPSSTIFATDLGKVKKNLQIQSLAHSFILIISSCEAIICLVACITNIYIEFGSNISIFYQITVGNTETNESCSLYGLTVSGMYTTITNNLAYLLPILLNLFLIVLRRACLNVQYKRWIIGYSGYFLFRFCYLVLSCYLPIARYVMNIIEMPFVMIDLYIFMIASKKFYLLLKGMSEEARWHSTPKEYKQKRKSMKTFGILRRIILFVFFIFITMVLLNSINEFALIIVNSDCLLRYLLPNTPIFFTLPKNLVYILYKISHSCRFLRMIGTGIVGVIVSLSNFAILTSIIVKLMRRRQKYIHINEWISRPLMEKYRADVGRHRERRPPFIQAFRSQLIY